MTTISKTLKLDAATVQRLNRLAERRGRSVHYLLCEAVQQFLVQEERSERLVQEALTDWQNTKTAPGPKARRAGDATRTITIIAVQQDA